MFRLICLPLVLSLCFLNAFSQSLGQYKSHKTSPEGIVVASDAGFVSLSYFDEDIVRVTVSTDDQFDTFSYAVIEKPKPNLYKLEEQPDKLLLSSGKLVVEIIKKPLAIRFLNSEGQAILEDHAEMAYHIDGSRITTTKHIKKEEKFVGLGEKVFTTDRRGRYLECQVEEHYKYEWNTDPLYINIPFFIGVHDSGTYGFYIDNPYKSTFNFGAYEKDLANYTTTDGDLNYFLYDWVIKIR